MNRAIVCCCLCFTLFSCSQHKEPAIETGVIQSKITKTRIDTVWNSEYNVIDRVEKYYNSGITNILFFEKGMPVKAVGYLKVNDKLIPNRLFIFNERGDTVKDKSLYHLLYYIKDTISLNEEYNFKIVLEGHLFDRAYLALSDVNSDFPDTSSVVVEMENLQIPLAVMGKNKGWNYIRGRIDNFKDGRIKGRKTWVQTYFLDSFYVR